jgi:acyl transferase domain-containing protein/thioesterase domain-containing protein/acyl carrier protein
MAGRFPGARNVAAFWGNLRDGVESIRPLGDDELRAAGVDAATLADPAYIKSAAVLDDIDQFDAPFFGFSPRDAAIMDPQHRQFLECAWEALEDAGRTPERFSGLIGVFAGCGMNAYFMFNLLSNPQLLKSVGLFLLRHTGNDKDFLSTRASYCFNLTGPSVNVQTACSTSLVAVHTACQSLLSGECDMALAGGVTIELPHGRGYFYQEGEIMSPDGHCRAFDERAQGTIFGSGVGVVVLRRLADALKDGDQIHAVIKGSAVNNDGSGKVGYFAPSVDGQSRAIREALSVADVSADSIGYVETHGTGTPVGDLIEIAALTQAFRAQTDRRGFCAIGSLKTNIGHLDTAAGVAGLIKVVLALKHQLLPPSLNCERPNPAFGFENTPFTVNTRLTEWRSGGLPRRAGISSLGIGGTNVHAVIEEAPAHAGEQSHKSRQLLLLSAQSAAALDRATRRLADFLERDSDRPSNLALADVAFTLQEGRRRFPHRRAVVCTNREDAVLALRGEDARRAISTASGDEAPPIVFLFPGGGAQFPGMGAELYREEPVYRDAVDRSLAFIEGHGGGDLRPVLFPSDPGATAAALTLQQPSNSVLSVFVTSYALGRLWMSWGVTPAAMIGHSLGEYTAACLAGVLSLEDALTIVSLRGAIFERLPQGAMTSVQLSESAVRPLLTPALSIAAVNGPSLCVVSGPLADIEAFERAVSARGEEVQRLRINVAAHSGMLDPHLAEFARQLASITMHAPVVPLISNETGTWATAAELTGPEYWVRQLRHSVRFADGLRTASGDRTPLFLEVGPGHSLTSLARMQLGPAAAGDAIPSMRHPMTPGSDMEALYGAAGRLWLRGHELDWGAVHGSPRRRVSLPTYPFEHKRYWIEPGQTMKAVAAANPASVESASPALPSALADRSSWFWTPVWRQTPTPAARPLAAGGRWLLFHNGSPTAQRLVGLLERVYAQRVIAVAAGDRFRKDGNGGYVVRPGERADYDALLGDLAADGGVPVRMIHLWLLGAAAPPQSVQQLAFESLFFLAQALAAADLPGSLHVVTDQLESIPGASPRPAGDPRAALAVGPALVIPQEIPNIACRLIDIAATPTAGADASQVASELLREVVADVSDSRVALRGDRRWVWDLEPAPHEATAPTGDFPRRAATYLVTGGLSGIGLELAGRIADTVPVRLVLLNRRGLPPRPAWDSLLRDSPDRPEAAAIRRIRQMEAAGAEVLAVAADLADPAAVALAVAAARQSFGHIDGVLHAAGIVEDAPLQMKDRESFGRVLAPKVEGLLALEAALGDDPPELLVLFSSTSAFLGLAGQVDYTAANAFLNTYARTRNRASATRAVAVQWGVWRDVGLAHRLVTPQSAATAPQAALDDTERHPLLGRLVQRSEHELVFEAELSVETHWVVAEHRLASGEAIVPGTAMVELARAALVEAAGAGAVEIGDLSFLEPLWVLDDASRLVRTSLRRDGTAWMLSVQSASGESWIEHARATLTRLERPAPGRLDVATLPIDRTSRSAAASERLPALQAAHLDFGPRWQSIRELRTLPDRCIAICELPPAFEADLEQFKEHPALLDMALSGGLALLQSRAPDDLYVPFSYDTIRIYAPLGATVISVVTPVKTPGTNPEFVEFDALVTDPTGLVLMEVEGFVMRRTSPAVITARLEESVVPPAKSPALSRLAALVQTGIGTDDGWQALLRVLNHTDPATSEIVVSSVDVGVLRASAEEATRRPRLGPAARPAGEPQNNESIPATIAAMWQDLLGVEVVGLDDDFFALGGHSLIALRLVAQLERVFKKKLRLATLFEARTVRQLAAVIDGGQALTKWLSIVPIQPHGTRPPFFCVHAVGGEALNYAPLGALCAPDQPFIAFRALGHDGQAEPLRSIAEQAAFYISEMTAYQPEGPYYIGGLSHGGRVALEMALQLEAAGKEVAFLGIIDTWPQDDMQRSLLYPFRWLRNLLVFGHDARQAHLARLQRTRYRVRQRLGRLLGRRVEDASTALGVPIEGVDVRDYTNLDDYPESVQRVLAINFAAFRAYRPQRRCGPLTLFRANIQPVFGPHQPDLGWSEVSRGPVDVRHLRGDHSSILDPHNVSQLAGELVAALQAAQARAAARRDQREQPAGPEASDRAAAPDPVVPQTPPRHAATATHRLSPTHGRR